MQGERSEQIPSGPDDDDSVSQGKKHRRTTERSKRRIPEVSESSNAPSTGRRTLTRSSPQRGSSREMSPHESGGTIKYTRTGRVSKATKGQRVHHCEECGKTYTRAEHLRRHQQNHKPGAFPCDVPGCGRSFYREDLLTRHKARHNDPFSTPSPPPSPASESPAPAESNVPLRPSSHNVPIATVAGPDPEPIDRSQMTSRSSGPSIGTRTDKGYLDINQLQHAGQLPVTLVGTNSYPDFIGGGLHWEPSPPYSPGGYDSPTNGGFYASHGQPYFQPHFSRTRQSSNASFLGYYVPPHPSRSPVSAGSSTIHLPQWAQSAQDPTFSNFSSSSESEDPFINSFGAYSGPMTDQQLLLGTFGSSRVMTPEERDLMEHDDLVIPARSPRGSPLDINLDENTFTNEERYLGAYWMWIHPLFPVVHRPSFIVQNASPLLRAAMLALGAHALGDAEDKRNARIIHERCTKVLKKRTIHNWHSFRTCDMQATVLVEIYSIFKSRRPPLQLSKTFEEVYQNLANDIFVLNGDLSNEDIVNPGASRFLNEFAHSIDTKCKQRLLQACYILDYQHATLFGRQRTVCYSGSSMDLPFPKPQSTWDANHDPRVPEEPTPSRVWEAVDAGNLKGLNQSSTDVFQSMLLLACLGESTELNSPDYAVQPINETPTVPPAMEQSPRLKMAYHTFALCQHTPIRDLLAVAGESWVMAEKLSTQADFTAAQIECHQWARGLMDSALDLSLEAERTPVNRAIRHAMKILELHLNHPRTGLLFQEWAVYLASIVIWARAYVTSNKMHHKLRLSISAPVERRLSQYDLDQSVSAVIAADSNGELDLDHAKKILIWTKARIENVDIPHNCGLTNGALDVLGKLVSRGTEEGWFG